MANGGKVVGGVRAPINTPDFSSFILQAQGLEGEGCRARQCRRRQPPNAIKQASESASSRRQKLAGNVVFITDVNALGLEKAQACCSRPHSTGT